MHPQDTIRPEIRDFAPYVPGRSIEEIRREYGLSTVVKMASNENPLGVSPLVQEKIRKRSGLVYRYPRANSPELTEALSARLGLEQNRLVIGNGSDEIIDLLIRIKARPGKDRIVIFEPSFSIYRLQAKLCGVDLTRIPLNPDFSFPFSSLLEHVDEHTAMVFVTNPDNPSGYAASRQDLVYLARALPPQTLLIVDEAYIDFASEPDFLSPQNDLQGLDNVVLLRTFSKLYGLAGLRLGYGIMPPWLADLLHRVKLPFSVNLLAEAAGLAALEDQAFVRMSREVVTTGREFLAQGFSRLGWTVYPSQANFVLVKPDCPADTLVEELLKRGYIIRPLRSYGLPDYVRISVGTQSENQGIVRACHAIQSSNA